MLSVARHYVKSEADAEDVLQSAYLLVVRFISRFAGTSKLSTWLHRIVVNSAFMLHRYRRRHPELSLDQPSLDPDRNVRTGAGLAALEAASEPDAMERAEGHRNLLAALERLPDTDRTAMRLCHVNGFTVPETARLLGRCSTTVNRDLRRGREALGRLMNLASRRSRLRKSRAHSSRRLPGAPLGSYAGARR